MTVSALTSGDSRLKSDFAYFFDGKICLRELLRLPLDEISHAVRLPAHWDFSCVGTIDMVTSVAGEFLGRDARNTQVVLRADSGPNYTLDCDEPV